MNNNVNFTQCQRNLRTYNGANGSKIGIIYNQENYMLKFPISLKGLAKGSYSNSCISEYIGCHIFKSLGFDTQETLLGYYQDKIVVACKDFTPQGYSFTDFASLKNTIIDSQSNGYGTELNDILKTFEEQIQFEISPSELKDFFWKMFIVDSFLANFDRHNGNWGFLVNEQLNKAKIAPIFDCGSCLFPRLVTEEGFNEALRDKEIAKNRLYVYPNSAIKHNGVKINLYNFLSQTDNKECLKALKSITEQIDMKIINKIIEETPYTSDLHKEFLKFTILDRKQNLLEKAILENKNIQNQTKEKNLSSKEINAKLDEAIKEQSARVSKPKPNYEEQEHIEENNESLKNSNKKLNKRK